jgi:hypothetical protein
MGHAHGAMLYSSIRVSAVLKLKGRLLLKDKSLTLAELKRSLKGRGPAMLLILLALPFCFIAIPGLSTPFGIAICLLGACLVIGHLTAVATWVLSV